MKKILIILGFVIAFTINSFSQKHDDFQTSEIQIDSLGEKKDLRIFLIKAIGKHLNTDQLFKTPKNNAILFSIAFSIDNNGKIDSFFLSNLSKENKEIINTDKGLLMDFRKIAIANQKYKNKILILPILFKRPDDTSILNLDEILSDYENLWPSIIDLKTSEKQIVLLKPFINTFFDPVR